MDPIKLIIVDDEPIIRKALKLELNASPHAVACGMKSGLTLSRYSSGVRLYQWVMVPTSSGCRRSRSRA